MTVSDQAAIDLLTEIARIPSLAGKEQEIGSFLVQTMERWGFAAEHDAVGNAIGRLAPEAAGDGVKHVILLGHMDTVPGNIPVQVRDGALYGRGAVDAKGPLATALVAAARASAHAAIRLTVIGAVQEEGPSVGARHLLDWEPPDYLVIAEPSGWDALVMGYKGSQRFTVELQQPSAHTAVPEPTVSERLVDFWQQLVAWCHQQGNPEASPNGKNATFDRLVPALISMSSDSDGLLDIARMQIGLRLPPRATLEGVRAGVQSLLPAASFEYQPGEVAVRGDKNTPLVAAFVRAIRDEGGTPRFKVKTGTSDMNVVGPAWSCPLLAYGPGDSRLDHTPEEHIALDEYLRGIRVLTRVLEGLS